MKKKLFVGIFTALTVFALCVGFAACNKPVDPKLTGNAYVAVDINPSVEFVVKDGVVTSVRALNYDARIMLYGSEGIIGATPDAAARVVAALALKYGYVTEANSDMGLTVESGDAETKTRIFDAVSTAMTDEVGKNGLTATVNEDAGVSAEHSLKKLKEAYPDNAAIQALTPADYRIVKAAMKADDTLTVEAAAAMDFDDMTEIIEESHKKYGEIADDKYELAVERAEFAYEAAVAALTDQAYAEADPVRGAEYVALRQAYLTLDRIEEIDGELAELSVITEDDLRFIAQKLGLDEKETHSFLESMTQGNGFIDEDSIEHYLDKLERNREKGKDGAQKAVKDNAKDGDDDDDDEDESGEDAFEDLLDEIEDYLDAAEDRAENLTAELKAEADAAIAAVKQYVDIGEVTTFDDVEDAVETLEERIEELEDYFDDNFTAEQKKIVKDYKAAAADKLDEAKAAYKKALEDAKTSMAAELEEAQKLRLEIVA